MCMGHRCGGGTGRAAGSGSGGSSKYLTATTMTGLATSGSEGSLAQGGTAALLVAAGDDILTCWLLVPCCRSLCIRCGVAKRSGALALRSGDAFAPDALECSPVGLLVCC